MTDLNEQTLEAEILELKKIMGDTPFKKRLTKLVLRPIDIQSIADRRGISFDEALADIQKIAKQAASGGKND